MTTTRWLLAAATVALGTGLVLADPVPPEDGRIRAQRAILDLAENLTAKDVADRAKKIVQEHDSCDISAFFVLSRHKGLGIGKLTELGIQDSVERLVQQLSKRKTTTEADLEKYRDDLLRVAKGLQAMAELAPHRGADFTRNDPDRAKAWANVSADFKVKTAGFRTAVEQGDPKQVRLAALALHHTCCECHAVRD